MRRYPVIGALLLAAGIAHAQPAPDFDHAKQLYQAAEEAMAAGHYSEAVDDFGGAYEITKDPVLFYKIGIANQKLGKCDVALIYFGRYLKEAHPNEKYQGIAKERIAECNAAAPVQAPVIEKVKPVETPVVVEKPIETPVIQPLPPVHHAHGNKTAWLLVGGAIAFATIGAVLAYSASSSEQDISDLYVGLNGVPPTYTPTTAARYNDLVDEGHRYQYLSWASFGVAGGAAIVAAVLFATGGHDEVVVTPVASGNSAGALASFRF